jgi:biopolymer transport protein ExbD
MKTKGCIILWIVGAIAVAAIFVIGGLYFYRSGRKILEPHVTVELPRDVNNADEDPAIQEDSAVIVSVPLDGKYYFGSKQITEDDLRSKLKEALTDSNKTPYIAAGVRVSYGEVVRVLRAARDSDAYRIGFVVSKSGSGGGRKRFLVSVPPQPDIALMEEDAIPQVLVSLDSRNQIRLEADVMGTISDPTGRKVALVYLGSKKTDQVPKELIADPSALNQRLSQLFQLRNQSRKIVIIKSARLATYGDVVRSIDAAKGAGANQIILQIDDLPD